MTVFVTEITWESFMSVEVEAWGYMLINNKWAAHQGRKLILILQDILMQLVLALHREFAKRNLQLCS